MYIKQQLAALFLAITLLSPVFAGDNNKTSKVILDISGIPKMKYTQEQINSLERIVELHKVKYSIHLGFYPVSNNKKSYLKLKKKYAKNNKTPFKIGMTILAAKESHGKLKTTEYTRGSADIYFINTEQKKIVTYKRVSLSKLCPT